MEADLCVRVDLSCVLVGHDHPKGDAADHAAFSVLGLARLGLRVKSIEPQTPQVTPCPLAADQHSISTGHPMQSFAASARSESISDNQRCETSASEQWTRSPREAVSINALVNRALAISPRRFVIGKSLFGAYVIALLCVASN